MTSDAFLFAGLLVGFSVAIPVGPMGLLCIQRTLASGLGVGLSSGLGGATANTLCAAIVLFGLDKLSSYVESGGRVLSALGGLFLLWSAYKTVMRRRASGDQTDNSVQLPLPAYCSAVLYNLTNPMSLVVMLALLSPLVAQSTPSPGDAAVLLAGLFAAVAVWWICLTGAVALLRSRLNARVVLNINRVAGVLLTFYGAVALARSAGL